MSVQLRVADLKVRSLDVDFFELSWKLEPSTEDVLDYTFQILRSEAAMGPFDAISPEFEDRYLFIDNRIKSFHNYRQHHYLVRIKHKASGQTKDFGPVQVEPDADLVAVELRKHINLLMQEFAGRRCWLLPVRTFGMRCQCWDATLQKKTRSGCRTCFDTGFIRGYMTPVEMWMQIDPSAQNENNNNVGPQQQNNTTARTGYFPLLKPRDVIVEAENVRWRVTQVTTTEQLRAPVHQEIQLHQIPRSDIEYAIPLKVDTALRDLFLAPPRNFTNPHTLESFEDHEIPGIFSIYPFYGE